MNAEEFYHKEYDNINNNGFYQFIFNMMEAYAKHKTEALENENEEYKKVAKLIQIFQDFNFKETKDLVEKYQALQKQVEDKNEAILALIYALEHPESNQQFAINAGKKSLT